MSFDYVSDLFGRYRDKDSKFHKVEEKATKLLQGFVADQLDRKAFGDGFVEVKEEFLALTQDKEGNVVFDEETPMWLNMFLGNKFIYWNQYRLALESGKCQEEPEFDKLFKEICRHCLNELQKNENYSE